MPYLHLPQAQGAYVLHLGNTYTHSILDMSCMDAYMDACMGFPGSGTHHHDHHGQHQEDQGRPAHHGYPEWMPGMHDIIIPDGMTNI